ncbi:MAG: LamG-like jellyroll fold domain-containing protein [Verrucomicrobiia bacterium]
MNIERKSINMQRFVWTLAAVLFCGHWADAAEKPLVAFDFDDGLKNAGTLGGAGQFKVYAPGEEAGYDLGPFGRCLDLTAASRHGGAGAKEPPAGGAVVFRHEALDKLDTFTITLWSRQSPLAHGASARLLSKDGSWDLLPAAGGAALALGPGASKVSYNLTGKTREKLEDRWRFTAVVVGPENVRAYIGGLDRPLVLCAEKSRAEHKAAARGDLVLGTFGGIRPFNGWLDRVRIFGGPLDEKAVREIFDADVASAKQAQPAMVFDLARLAAKTHRFQLKRSDIPFSTRWQKNKQAPAIMESFHTTQCLWVYGTGTNFIQQIKGMGIGYQGTLNGLQGQEHSTTNRSARGDTSGRHEDLDGNKNTPSWMVTFGPKTFTGCCNHPAFRKLFFEAAKRHLDAGVDMLHVDDWAMNASWVLNGAACFCEHCRAGFRGWLKNHCSPDELRKLRVTDIAMFDYREHLKHNGVPDAATYKEKFRELPLTPQFTDFQVESMRTFFREFRRHLDEWSPKKYVPVSVNALLINLHPHHNLCGVDVVDFFTGESSQNADYQTEAEYVFAAKAAEAFGMSQVVSPIPRSTARTRAALATTCALGQLHLVPWDIYMGSDATGIQPRYFGTREQYGDLYDFIHEHKALFDDHESAAEVGVLANADAPGKGSLLQFCKQLTRQQIPFHLILGASQYARVPVRAADLRAVRMLVQFSATDSFCKEDQKTIQAARESGLVRFLPPSADLAAAIKLRGMELLRVEAPEGVYAFPRVNRAKRSAAIHLVNWNLAANGERAETYRNVTLTLLQPQRWGKVASATWLQPGRKPVTLKPERHDDCVRLTLPQIEAWGVVEIK